MKLKTSYKVILTVIVVVGLASCVSVESYQKMYINDKDMILSDQEIERFEIGFQTYRESTSGANGGKSGGGCGCN